MAESSTSLKRHVALIIFYDEQGRILLQDRRNRSKWGEEWGFFGGGIEPGETPEQAVIRETREELTHELKDFRFVETIHYPEVGESGGGSRSIFIAPLGDKLQHFDLKEGRGMQLFSFAEARKLKMVVGDDKLLDRLEKEIKV
jgi:8-oxo-dGTP pyrophosphatase MutT (NUDIX family)